jgi:hypothetical protein
VVNVQPKSEWGKKFCKELECMFAISKKLSAEMLVFFSDDPIEILNDCIERGNVKNIVLDNSEINIINFVEKFHLKSEEMKIHICKYQ